MGNTIVPPFGGWRPIETRPVFVKPAGLEWSEWTTGVLELWRDCPPPLGLYDGAPIIVPPDPRDPERR